MIGFLKGNGGLEAAFSRKQQGACQKGAAFAALLAPKPGA